MRACGDALVSTSVVFVVWFALSLFVPHRRPNSKDGGAGAIQYGDDANYLGIPAKKSVVNA